MKKKFQVQLAQARREQIVDAAIEVIVEQGFQRTTIKQIAAKAEIADGTIYNYFKNKNAILLAIIERFTEAETREIDFAEAEQIDFEQFITMYVAHRMQEIDANYPSFKVVLPETLVNVELSQTINEQIYAPSFAIAEKYFQHLMEQGVLESADPVVMSRLFASPLLGLLFLRLLGDEHVAVHWETYSDAMIQFLLKAYAPGHSPAGDGQAEDTTGE